MDNGINLPAHMAELSSVMVQMSYLGPYLVIFCFSSENSKKVYMLS